MRKVKFCFYATGDFNIGSYRIPFIWLKEYLVLKGFKCVENIIDPSIDIYICKGGQEIATKIRKELKDAYIILFKPHYEIDVNLDFKNPIKFAYRFLSFLIECSLKSKQNKFNNDIKSCSLIIADSKKLELFYLSKFNKRVLYFRLLEKISFKADQNFSKKIGNELVFLYHGSIKHYNENLPEIKKLLIAASEYKPIRFICIADLNRINKKINLKNIVCEYHEYNYSVLLKSLEIADIGYIPNFLRPRIPCLKSIYNILNFKIHQLNLSTKTEKNSANAGRAYLFASYGVPFIAHPTREVVADFKDIDQLYFPNNSNEAVYYIRKLIEDNILYSQTSKKLFEISKKYTIEIESEKLLSFLECNYISNKI